jgi:hypothetical protein
MKKSNRRHFMKKSIQGTAIIGAGLSSIGMASDKTQVIGSPKSGISAAIPKPIQVVIDDVGWWSGKDGSKYQEPYRTGINRNHVPEDYQAIVELGKALGIRPQAAFILSEWDRQNILGNVPHCTWMGTNWDNSKWIGPWLEEASDIINSNKDNFEITMHGLGHEWWINGEFTRAEWADKDGVMRPKDDLEQHIDAFVEIMRQNNLGDLPTSFVPTAFNHGFGVTPGNKVSMAAILNKTGFAHINTPFSNMLNKENVQYDIFGVDSGVMTIDRGSDILGWDVIGQKPEGEINGTTCGMHWPNLLHEDPSRNSEIVDAWIKLLAPYHENQETILAKNSLEFQQQLAHFKCTDVKSASKEILLDFSKTDEIGTTVKNSKIIIKVSSNKELVFSGDQLNLETISTKKESESILYTLRIDRSNLPHAKIKYD